ncbi:IS1182 family transposase [Ruminococcaceae bacterium OttesenSCG-928-D13]|nr:IS1182 family transposase [Ruminococcaceae bacterium OttesenSCG-928-D13]
MLERNEDKRYAVKFACLDSVVPEGHLLRKIEKAIGFEAIYPMVEHLYCEDNGRPAADPVVLVKMALLQHLYGIPSLRRTRDEVEMNIAYRWFIGYDIDTPVPHFATLSYAFATRFPSEVFEQIFSWILEEAVRKGLVKPQTIFIDATHVKANANKKKRRKELAQKTARIYDEQLRAEIEADRAAHGKKPLKERGDDNDETGGGSVATVSTTDPESGLFRKGEHKTEFAYTAHVACDEGNFVLACEVTPGNVHDSKVFDAVYEEATNRFGEVETVTVDAGYKTPWICKKVIDDGRNISTPYKRPMTGKDFFKSYDYVYDEYYDCVVCPQNQVLKYTTSNRDGYREYKSNPAQCKDCPKLAVCTHSKNHQKVVQKHIWDNYIEVAEDFRHSPEGDASYTRRGQTIERVFADAKEKHGMRYTLLRGLTRVTNWLRLKFAAMNLKKMAMGA